MKSPLLAIVALALGCKHEPPPPPPVAASSHAATADNRTVPGTTQPTTVGAPPPAGNVDPPAPAASFHEAGQYLPQGSIGAWAQSGAVRYFNAQTIFQEMDGAGDAYNAYGFHQLAKTDYRRGGMDLAVTAEVYDMGSPLGAFGRYSLLLSDSRDPATMESHAVPLGAGGYLGTSQVVFWKGSYLVQLNLEDEGGTRDEAALATLAHDNLVAIGTVIAALLPASTATPDAPAGFPADGLVWGGRTYLADNALEAEHSGPAWIGHYRDAASSQRYRVAVLARATPAEAHASFSALRGAQSTALAGVGEEAAAVTGSRGDMVLARKGNTVIVVADPSPAGLPALGHDAKLQRLRAIVATLP